MGKANREKQSLLLQRVAALPGYARWLIGYAFVLCAAVMLVYYWRVVFTLGALPALPATLAVAGVFSVLYLALYLISRFLRGKICLQAAAVVFVLGVLFCFATAPLQVPDESGHYLRAASISMGRFTYDYGEQYPQDISLFVQEFSGFANHEVQYQNGTLTPQRITDYTQAVSSGDSAEVQAESPIIFMLLPYLLQGAFMALVRLFGFGALGMLYAGRLANLLIYTAICYFAFANCQRYRGVMIAFALLPLSLFMAASCSYDSIVLAVSYYLISFFCKDGVTKRDVVWFMVALVVGCYIKINTILLLPILLMIPKSRWKTKLNPWLCAAACAAAAMLFWFVMGNYIDGGVLKMGWPQVLPRGSGDAADPMGQLMFVLANPLRFISTALLSVYEGNGFLFDLGRLGSMDLVLPLASGLSVVSLCAASALGIQQKEDTKTGTAVALGLAALLYGVAVLGAMYVFDTDIFSIRITGQQPRYFLPAFLLLFMLGSVLLGRAVRPKLRENGTQLRTQELTMWIAVAVALVSAVMLFQNYFVGQWYVSGEGVWTLINLFGRP